MKEFRLGLITGGLMEDPDFHVDVDTISVIHAKDLKTAKQKWAVKTGHDNEYWDKEQQTYWGWQVREV